MRVFTQSRPSSSPHIHTNYERLSRTLFCYIKSELFQIILDRELHELLPAGGERCPRCSLIAHSFIEPLTCDSLIRRNVWSPNIFARDGKRSRCLQSLPQTPLNTWQTCSGAIHQRSTVIVARKHKRMKSECSTSSQIRLNGFLRPRVDG